MKTWLEKRGQAQEHFQAHSQRMKGEKENGEEPALFPKFLWEHLQWWGGQRDVTSSGMPLFPVFLSQDQLWESSGMRRAGSSKENHGQSNKSLEWG